MRVTSGCHCGHITYEAEVDPVTVRVCHCTDCQRLTGTAFRANIASLPGTFRLKSGTPRIYIKTAESGTKPAHAFCPECGTPCILPRPNQTNQRMACGSEGSTSVRNLRHRSGRFGAVRRCPGRWTCERSRKRSMASAGTVHVDESRNSAFLYQQ
jgi:hypothetical protein